MGIINFKEGNFNKTSVDNEFITSHMFNLSGDFVKIYLYVLMCNEAHKDITLDDIANKFGIFSSEVIKALTALSNEGLFTVDRNGDDLSLSFDRNSLKNNYPYAEVSFNQPLGIENNNSFNDAYNQIKYNMNNMNDMNMNINSNSFNGMNNQVSFLSNKDLLNFNDNYTSDNQAKDSVLSFTNNVNNNTSKAVYDYMNQNVNQSQSNALKSDLKENEKYSIDELAFLLNENPDINDVKSFIEKTYGVTFDAPNLQTLVSIVCCDYVPVNSLKTIVSYLYNNNTKITKLNALLRALETKAIEINERGLGSDDEINDYLTNTSAVYMNIVRRFGILGRGLVPGEKNMVDKWLYSFKMPLDLIYDAIDKTVRKTGKASFEYCNSILTNMKDEGIKNLNDLNKQNANKPNVRFNTPNSDMKQTNKFNNYTQTNNTSITDFDRETIIKHINKYGNNFGDNNSESNNFGNNNFGNN